MCKYSTNPLPLQKKQHLSEKSGITSSMEHTGPQLISTFELAPVHSSGTTPFSQQPVVLTKQAYIELKWEANYWRAQHERVLCQISSPLRQITLPKTGLKWPLSPG